MKCPECGLEGVLESDKFCGECGANIGTNESKWDAPKWKWGSLIASTVLVFLFWLYILDNSGTYTEDFLLGLAIYGFPTMIYILYKERTKKIKYGLAWITFPLITLLGSNYWEDLIIISILLAIPAIVIDVWYVHKLKKE